MLNNNRIPDEKIDFKNQSYDKRSYEERSVNKFGVRWKRTFRTNEHFFHNISTYIAHKAEPKDRLTHSTIRQMRDVLSKIPLLAYALGGKENEKRSPEEIEKQAQINLCSFWTGDAGSDENHQSVETICKNFYLNSPSSDELDTLDEEILRLLGFQGDTESEAAHQLLHNFFSEKCGDNFYQKMHSVRILAKRGDSQGVQHLLNRLEKGGNVPIFALAFCQTHLRAKGYIHEAHMIAEQLLPYLEEAKLQVAKDLLYGSRAVIDEDTGKKETYLDIDRAKELAQTLPDNREADLLLRIASFLENELNEAQCEELDSAVEELVGKGNGCTFYANIVPKNIHTATRTERTCLEHALSHLQRYAAKVENPQMEFLALHRGAYLLKSFEAKVALEKGCRTLYKTERGAKQIAFDLAVDLRRETDDLYYSLQLMSDHFWLPSGRLGSIKKYADSLIRGEVDDSTKEIARKYKKIAEIMQIDSSSISQIDFNDILEFRYLLEDVSTEEDRAEILNKFCLRFPDHFLSLFFSGNFEVAEQAGLNVKHIQEQERAIARKGKN